MFPKLRNGPSDLSWDGCLAEAGCAFAVGLQPCACRHFPPPVVPALHRETKCRRSGSFAAAAVRLACGHRASVPPGAIEVAKGAAFRKGE